MSRRQVRQVGFDGSALRAARLAAGLTQEGLARKMGVTLRTVTRWEESIGQPNGSKLIALAGLLGIDPDEFYVDEVAA